MNGNKLSKATVLVLVLSLVVGTSIAYADPIATTPIGSYNVLVTGENSFVLNGMEFTAYRIDVNGFTEAVLVDEHGFIAEHVRLDFTTGIVTEVNR